MVILFFILLLFFFKKYEYNYFNKGEKMTQVSSVLVLIGGLIAGYFAYPTLNPPTKSLNYEQLVKQISNSLKSRSDNQHDELLMHEVLEQNSRLNLQYEGQKQALEIERELRE